MASFGRIVLVWAVLLIAFSFAVEGAEVFPTFTSGKGLDVFSIDSPFEEDESGPIRFWKFLGQSLVAAEENSGTDVLRLTNAVVSERGMAYSRIPFQSNEFEGFIDFKVKTPARRIAADGMTFFALNKPPQLGPVYGLEESFDGLVIVLDTFANSKKVRTPIIYAMYGDGTNRDWQAISDGADRALSKGCFINLKFDDRILFRVRGDTVYVAIGSHHHTSTRMCFTATGVKLRQKDGIHFGFSAETGHFFSEHQISKFQVKALSKYPNVDPQELQFEIEEEEVQEVQAYKDLFNALVQQDSSHDHFEAYDDDDYDDDYDDYEDYDDYDYDDEDDEGQQQQHQNAHNQHGHGHRHGHRPTNKHLEDVEKNMNHLKLNMMHLLRKAAPDADDLNDALHEIKEDLGMILEIVDETDLSFEDIDETAEDLPDQASNLMKTVDEIKTYIDRVEEDLSLIEDSCEDIDHVLDGVDATITVFLAQIEGSLNGNGFSFWLFAVASQALVGLVFTYVFLQEKSKGSAPRRGARSTFGRLV